MDDLRQAPKDYVTYRTAEALLSDIKEGKINYINTLSLDHDMGVDTNNQLIMNGSQFIVELINAMIDTQLTINHIQFHTSNTVGFQYMQSTLKQAQKRGFIDSQIKIDNHLTDYLKFMAN